MRVNPDSVDGGDIVIKCPKCHTKHRFNQSGFNTWFLNDDRDDLFTSTQVGSNMNLFPMFVCRNVKCEYETTLTINMGEHNG